MIRFKRAIANALCICMIAGSCSITAQAAERQPESCVEHAVEMAQVATENTKQESVDEVADTEEIDANSLDANSLDGKFKNADAYMAIDAINEQRLAATLKALNMDTELMEAAKTRAEEISRVYSHNRPSGESYSTVSAKAKGEIILTGESANQVVSAWMNSNNKKAILKDNFVSIGAASYEIGGQTYWVALFGYEASVDYSLVYDYDFYMNKYPEVAKKFADDPSGAFQYFLKTGMWKGHQASKKFDFMSYKNAYVDLRRTFNKDWPKYYMHYIQFGAKEGRVATGVTERKPAITQYGDWDYKSVFNFNYYCEHNPDVYQAFGENDMKVLLHFINYGMAEKRRASENFDLQYYVKANPDLRASLGTNWVLYYVHFMFTGEKEGRKGSGETDLIGAITKLDGVEYAPVYDYNYYIEHNPDVYKAFGDNDLMTLWHYVNYGMAEGREATDKFSLTSYAYEYPDLRKAFGNGYKNYVLHYLNYGIKEGRNPVGTEAMVGYVTTWYGVDYSDVYDCTYYASQRESISEKEFDDSVILKDFVENGMTLGIDGSAKFNVMSYAYANADVRNIYKNNYKKYYLHYILFGKSEGRVCTGVTQMQDYAVKATVELTATITDATPSDATPSDATPTDATPTDAIEVGPGEIELDFSSVYDYNYIVETYPELKAKFGFDDEALLHYFVTEGIKNGMIGSAEFDIKIYAKNYTYLGERYQDNFLLYYADYILFGKEAGRNAKTEIEK